MPPLPKLLFFALGVLLSTAVRGEPVLSIELDIPKLEVEPYHRPYVAVWLETPQREAIATLAVWHEQDTWLKDLRQWWRKVGRSASGEIDGVTGATRKPGRYRIVWDGKNNAGKAVSPGEYLLNIEAVREEGDRSYLRQTITLGKAAIIKLPAKNEFGPATVTTQ